MEYQTHSPVLSSVGGHQIGSLPLLATYVGNDLKVFSQDVQCWYYLSTTSTATVDGFNVITAAGGGRWLRFTGYGQEDLFSVWRQRAILLAGIDPTKICKWEVDFTRQEGYDTAVSGGGLAVQGATSGGTMQLSAPTGAAEFAGVKNSQFTPIPHTAFHMGVRARVDAGSATTNIYPLSLTQVGQSFGDTLPAKGVSLRIVNGVMTLRISDGLASVTTVATTWTVETAAYHVFEVVFDGTTLQCYVDWVSVLAAAPVLTNLTLTACMPCSWLNNQNDITVISDITKIGAYLAEA